MAGGNLSRKTTVFAKLEAVQGTDIWAAADPAATDAQLIFGDGAGIYTPDVAMVDLQPLRGTLTQTKNLHGRALAKVALQTCLMSKGSAGAPSPWFDALLRACGNGVVGSAPASSSAATYAPIDSAFKSVSVAVYADGLKHLVTGCMGTATLDLTAGQAPKLNFDLQGVLGTVSAVATPAATFPTDNKTLVGSETLRITPLGGSAYTPIVRSIQVAFGVGVVERNDANAALGFSGLFITSRAPTVTLVIETDTILSALDPINDVITNKTHAIEFTHGSGVQSKIIFTAATAELGVPTYSDDNGFRMYNLPYRLQSATAMGEWTLAFHEKQ